MEQFRNHKYLVFIFLGIFLLPFSAGATAGSCTSTSTVAAYTTANDQETIGYNTNDQEEHAQKIEFASPTDVGAFEFQVAKWASPSDDLTIEFRSGGNAPGDTLVDTLTIANANLATWNSWTTAEFYIGHQSLSGVYYLRFKRTGAFNTTNNFVVRDNSSANIYTGGNLWRKSASWSELNNRDIVFTIYDCAAEGGGGATSTATSTTSSGTSPFVLIPFLMGVLFLGYATIKKR